MDHGTFRLLATSRFLPLFLTQFLDALNANLFKQALVVLIAYRLAEQSGANGQILVTIAAAIFILPFFLFSATAGQLADRYEKSHLVRLLQLMQIAVMGLAAAGFVMERPYFLIAVLFLMGLQSALFGPLKYSILPDHLKTNELIAGNALIEGATFLAILLGAIAGGLGILAENGLVLISSVLVVFAAMSWIASRFIPKAESRDPDIRINPNFLGETWSLVRTSARNLVIFRSILAISWFWLLGATYLAQLPAFTKDVLGADETVVTLFMALFSVGIGLGSLICSRLLKGDVSARFVPLSCLGMTVFTIDLYLASRGRAPEGAALIGALEFLTRPDNIRIAFDMTMVAVTGGIYSVPLYALLQSESEPRLRSRMIAANNVMNALFMVTAGVASTLMLARGVSIPGIFLALAVGNVAVTLYVINLLPQALFRTALAALLKLLYRVEVRGIENFYKAGPRAVIVANHAAFLDPAVMTAFLPSWPIFAVDTHIATRWWLKPFLTLGESFTMDPTKPLSTKTLIKRIQDDRHVVIFPEGRLTITGGLMKIYDGPAMVADRADAMVLPIRLDGPQYTPFSRLKGVLKIRWFPKITMTILPPRKLQLPASAVGRERRRLAGIQLHDIMTSMMFETCERDMTLFEALLGAARVHGASTPLMEDIERKPIAYRRIIMGAHLLGVRIAKRTALKERVGILLPNSNGLAVTFFALQAFGRVPAMLNFSTGLRNMLAALQAAEIKTILTSRRFVEAAKFEETVERLSQKAKIVYLEDLRGEIGPLAKISGLLAARWRAGGEARRAKISTHDPAVVLFTSGSEGVPKGVVLSHNNLLSNLCQLAALVDFNPTDVLFNALPLFHSFGLTAGLLLPLLSGVRVFLYPSPLHYRIVPALAYDTNATIMFGTDTFLTGYWRRSHPFDFFRVRYVFAGAERIRSETRKGWAEKFGLRILDGYGITETSPVLSANTPFFFKPGTVGRFLPGIKHRLEPVEGIERGGRLIVSGPNIMLGYLKADRPGELQPPPDGEYDTGDIVDVDADGFVTILGRAKRFAKVAGEMVSLGAVEEQVAAVWPGWQHAVVAIPDPRRGETLILVTDRQGATREALLAHAREAGIAEIQVPREIKIVEQVPVLGTGKTDYVTIERMVKEKETA